MCVKILLTLVFILNVIDLSLSASLPDYRNTYQDEIEERIHKHKRPNPCRLNRNEDVDNKQARTFFNVDLAYVSVNNNYNSPGQNQHPCTSGGHGGLLGSHIGWITMLIGGLFPGNGGGTGGPISTAIAMAGAGGGQQDEPEDDTAISGSLSSGGSSGSQSYSSGAGLFGNQNTIIGSYLDLFGLGTGSSSGNRPSNDKPVYENNYDDIGGGALGDNHKFIGANNQLRQRYYSNRPQRQFNRSINQFFRPLYRLF